jgi:hypothetical protein
VVRLPKYAKKWPQEQGLVYFLRSGDNVKIGKSTISALPSRINSIQTGCPKELSLLAVVKADNALAFESELHARFATDRQRGEWFKFSPAIAEYLAEHGCAKPSRHTGWRCDVCGKAVPAKEGWILLRDSRDSDDGRPLAHKVVHKACDPSPEDEGFYEIAVERARTLREWVDWLLHLCSKSWINKRDIQSLMLLWFSQHGGRPNV